MAALNIGSILGRPGQHCLPGPATLRYGGNTPCVELRCGADTLIFDAGTGIRPLGNALVTAANTNDFDIFLSHGHIDHVIGLPFFAPLFVKDQVVRVWAGNLQPAGGVKKAVRKLMSFPFFPLQVDALHAKLEFHDFQRRRRDQSPAGCHLANRAAQSSRRRHRLPDRIRRTAPSPM